MQKTVVPFGVQLQPADKGRHAAVVQAHHHPEKADSEPVKSTVTTKTGSKGKDQGTEFGGHLLSPALASTTSCFEI
ncbi:MAG: hypothetical protein DDT30_01157 [Dehalococcoidia bacterium]|nr:hypothetical protein [Bacillota bacterium]